MFLHYYHKRLSGCKYGELKTSCKKCHAHCCKKDMWEKISEVMRFSGLRMMKHHPIVAIKHLFK